MPKASVKIMRSYDYCHFEIALGSDEDLAIDDVNELRKVAALLVDEAVRQYKIARQAETRREYRQRDIQSLSERINHIQVMPESEWSIEDAALMRSYEDGTFWKSLDDESYIYDDEPERDHHFSMLRRFQDVQVSAGLVEIS